MKIKKILPYFIKRIDSQDEFINLQLKLFSDGYEWIGSKKIWIPAPSPFLEYPFYISNLPFKKYSEKIIRLRETYDKFYNNILYIDKDSDEFDTTFLRLEKLNKINKLKI